MFSAAMRATWASLVVAFVVLPLVAGAQVPSDPLRGARITQVEIVLQPPPADPQVARNLEGAVRKAFRVYPGDQYDATRVDFGLSRVRGVPGVARASVKVEFADQQGLRLVVTADTSAAPRPARFANRLRLVDDGEKLLKLQVSLKGAIPVSGNQWFGNGPALTQYSPYGRYTAGNGPNTAYDVAPKIGIAGIFPVMRGEAPVYAYGHLSVPRACDRRTSQRHGHGEIRPRRRGRLRRNRRWRTHRRRHRVAVQPVVRPAALLRRRRDVPLPGRQQLGRAGR